MRCGIGAGSRHPAGQRPGLQRQVTQARDLVARRLGPAVLALLLGLLRVDRDGLPLERVQRTAALVEGVGDVLTDVGLIEVVPLVVGVNPAAADEGGVAALDGRVAVQRRIEVGAGGDEVAHALAVLVQADVERVADEEAEVAVVLRLVLVDPGEHVFPGLVGQPAINAAAQEVRLQPVVLPVLQDRDRARHVRQRGGAHDATGHHEAGVRPLPTEDGVNLDRLLREHHTLLVGGADVGGEAADGLVIEGGLGVILVHQVDGEQRVEVARNRLQGLAGLGDIAHQRRIGRHGGLPRGVQRVGRLVQVAATADAADARTHDETGLRVLAAQDDLEAAEHRGFGPGRGDDPVGDGDPDVEVTLDASERADV